MSAIRMTMMAAPLACTCSSVSAWAENDNGYFASVSLAQNQSNYTLTLPTSLFSDDVSQFSPSTVALDINSSNCLYGTAGYRWNGGNKNVGGVSWSVSTGARISHCSSVISADLAAVKAYVLDRIDTAVRDTINTEINNTTPSEFYTVMASLGPDPSSLISTASEGIANYVLDPTIPVPSNQNISAVFDYVPNTPYKIVDEARDEIEQVVLSFAGHTRDVRSAIGFVSSLPDYPQGTGIMLSFDFTNSAEQTYHFSRNAHLSGGISMNATVKASFNSNPLPQIIGSENVVVPFYGYDGSFWTGVTANDALGDFDLTLSAHKPFRNFTVPMKGVTLEQDDKPYISLSLTDGNASVAVTHDGKNLGLNAGFTF